ncbi:MAG: hypothetical protein AMXMBFR84_04680 [Candidatus Hydrogenedentota bacterium]
MAISAEAVRQLREATGAGMMDCKKALTETNGDFEKAVVWLREKGMASAAKRSDRSANQGAVFSYIHMKGKYGVIAELNCETDFVASTDDFQNLGRDICQHICAAAPKYVRREEVPAADIEAEKSIYKAQAAESGKPEPIQEKMALGKLDKWMAQVCLMEQAYVKDPERSVEEIVKEVGGKLGEKVAVRRFVRFELGESIGTVSSEEN